MKEKANANEMCACKRQLDTMKRKETLNDPLPNRKPIRPRTLCIPLTSKDLLKDQGERTVRETADNAELILDSSRTNE